MGFLDILMDEHRGFKAMLDVLDAVVLRLDRGGQVPPEMVGDVIDFFDIFAHRHHGKEEDLLFPLLEQHGMGPDSSVVAALLSQHEIGIVYTGKIRADFRQVVAGRPEARNELVAHARDYSELIREHIRIEDEYFYKLAYSLLTESERASITEGLRGPRDRMPAEGRQRYLEMIPRYGAVVAEWALEGR
jgi:hemerythrin-like domain-containing protein